VAADMPYRLSERARNDVVEIARYTTLQFGAGQRQVYQGKLMDCFRNLSDNPELGKKADEVKAGLRMLVCQSHVIFYKLDDADNVLIARVMHSRADPHRHF